MSPVLVGVELRKSHGLTPALRGASISVDEGETVAVMGRSGSGKSTLLHCLAGVLTPDSGEVYFAGQRIDRLPDRRRVELRRGAFGLVYQFGQLVPELPAVENIALPLLLAGKPRRASLAEARAWLTRMDLAGLDDRLPGELSGGQGQRVALARALVARPKVVFADEPTGSLDSVGADQVMELLADAAKEQGAAVLVVTHEPRVAGLPTVRSCCATASSRCAWTWRRRCPPAVATRCGSARPMRGPGEPDTAPRAAAGGRRRARRARPAGVRGGRCRPRHRAAAAQPDRAARAARPVRPRGLAGRRLRGAEPGDRRRPGRGVGRRGAVPRGERLLRRPADAPRLPGGARRRPARATGPAPRARAGRGRRVAGDDPAAGVHTGRRARRRGSRAGSR